MYSTSIYMVIDAVHGVKPPMTTFQWTVVIIALVFVNSIFFIDEWHKYFPAKPKEANKAEERLMAKRLAEKGGDHE